MANLIAFGEGQCKTCGRALAPHATFCPQCGTRVADETSDVEANKITVRRLYDEVMSQGKLALVDQICTPDHDYFTPGVPGGVRGRESLKDLIEAYRRAFPDLTFTVEDLVAEGDRVVARYSGQGTQRGELMGISPTGKHVTLTGIAVRRFVNGRIDETREEYDALGLLYQLGGSPVPETVGQQQPRRSLARRLFGK